MYYKKAACPSCTVSSGPPQSVNYTLAIGLPTHHPNATVDVYATELPLDFFAPLTRWGYRVRVVRLDDALLADLGAGCPGQEWLARLAEWRRGPYFYSHLTDFLRFCLLYRYGGIYSDFDALLLRPLDVGRPAFIGKDASRNADPQDAAAAVVTDRCDWCLEDNLHYLAPGVMAAPAGSAVVRAALALAFEREYRPEVFNAVGPRAITAAYNLVQPSEAELYVYEPPVLYPLPYWRAHELLAAPPRTLGPAVRCGDAGDADDAGADALCTAAAEQDSAWAGAWELERIRHRAISLHLFGHMTGRLPVAAGSVVDHVARRLAVAPLPPVVDGAAEAPPATAWTLQGPPYAAAVRTHTPLRAWRVVPPVAEVDKNSVVRIEARAAVVPLCLAGVDTAEACAASGTLTRVSPAGTVAEANGWLARLYTVTPPPADSGLIGSGRFAAWNGTDTLVLRVVRAGGARVLAERRIAVLDLSRLLTVMVKTLDRMDKVFELIRSLRQRYPFVPVIVADDGERASRLRRPERMRFAYVPLPFDAGLSAGRNAMVDRVATPLVLTLDDDFTLDEHSALEALVHVVASGEADIAAGRNPVDEGLYGFEFVGLLQQNGTTLHLRRGQHGITRSGCRHVDIVPNLFVARTELLRHRLRWDDALKLGEHEDFFLRAQAAGVRVVSCPAVSFVHGGSQSWFQLTATSSQYDRLRSRIHRFWEQALRKHGLQRLVSFGTVVMDLQGPDPVTGLAAGEVLPNAVTLYWQPSRWATSYRLVAEKAGGGARVEHDYATSPVMIIDLAPHTRYTFTVYALLAHVVNAAGQSVTVTTRRPLRGFGLVRNGGFEDGARHWRPGLGTVFHSAIDSDGGLSGRLQIHASAYLSRTPAVMRVDQDIDTSALPQWRPAASPRAVRRFVVAAWSRIENLFGDVASVTYRLAAEAHCADGAVVRGAADYAVNQYGWQFRSFSLEMAPSADVVRVTVSCILAGHRGAVFFDNVTVVDDVG